MGLKAANRKMVDLRRAPKDIVESFKNSGGLGEKMEALGKVRRNLTNFLRSNVLRK